MGKKRFSDTDSADGGGLHVPVCALMVSSDDLNLTTFLLVLDGYLCNLSIKLTIYID